MRPEQARKWLSEPRFRGFKKAVASQDHESAVALYMWNADISAAFLGVLHHIEVLLRNAIDRQFPPTDAGHVASICNAGVWLTDPAILEDRGREKVNDAIGRLASENRKPTRGRLVASLTFGFWTALFAGRYEGLWRSYLVGAFPNGDGRRNEVRKALARILQLRNQIAHHEAIFARNLAKDHETLLNVAALIDPEAAPYIAERSKVVELLPLRPSLLTGPERMKREV
jgi:Abi-like protein